MSVQGNLTKLAATGKELFQEPLGTFGFELLKYVCVRECEMGRFEKFSWVLFLVILFELGRFDKSGGRRWRDGICLLPDLSYPHFNLDLRDHLFAFHFSPTFPLWEVHQHPVIQLVFKVPKYFWAFNIKRLWVITEELLWYVTFKKIFMTPCDSFISENLLNCVSQKVKWF